MTAVNWFTTSSPPNIVGIVASALLFVLQIFVGLIFRTFYFMLMVCIGLAFETAGYAGRAVVSWYPGKVSVMMLQAIALGIGPYFIMHAIYIQIWPLFHHWGHNHKYYHHRFSRLIFMALEFLAFLFQIIGFGLLAGTYKAEWSTGEQYLKAARVLISIGLGLQLLVGVLFFFFGIHFWLAKAYSSAPDKVHSHLITKLLVPSLIISMAALIVRGVYRIYDQWRTDLHTEKYFLILDGLMVLIASVLITLIHPGPALGIVPNRGVNGYFTP